MVRRWREGGQSVRAFCRAEGLRESAFYFWRRRLARRGQPAAVNGSRPQALGDAHFAVVQSQLPQPGLRLRFCPCVWWHPQATAPGVAQATGGVEIVLAQGRTVRVPAGFDRQTLADVLAVLEVRPC